MIIPCYYEDPHTLHVGTMPNRAYYIPSSRRSDALVEHRETSDRFQLLNGSWKFRYYASIYDLQDAFYEVGYDASAFDSIPVPSVWQNHGYDHHQYTNIRYPFPADPPYVPKENPCGAYLYDFTYQKDAAAPRAFLNFEGVASCLCLAQRSVCRVQSGRPFHKRVRCNEVFAGRHQPSGGPRAEMVRWQLHGRSGYVPHERHFP